MGYRILDIAQEHLEPALGLLFDGLRAEAEANPLLPVAAIQDAGVLPGALEFILGNPGVAAFDGHKLVGYMVTGAVFDFKGQRAALVPEYAHAAVHTDRAEIYRRMYMKLSETWVQRGMHLHIIGHLAHDHVLRETLFLLGFGAILSEKLRGFAPIIDGKSANIVYESDPSQLLAIQMEHNAYYPLAPIFIRKDRSKDEVLSDLRASAEEGDVFIVHYDNGQPLGYFTVGESATDEEGFLLQRTNTAQIKAAFIKASARGRGIGSSLLQESMRWAEKNGFDRLFVEHETANYYGGNFWNRHFSSYQFISMRYVDSTIRP